MNPVSLNGIATRVPYDFLVSSGAMAGNATATGTINMFTDADFELWAYALTTSLDNANDPAPNNVSIQMQIQTTGQLMSNVAIPQAVITGLANRLYQLPQPVVVARNSVILVTFTNLINSTNTAQLVWRGYKLIG